jgi:uncharacterized protein (DUF1684 family)
MKNSDVDYTELVFHKRKEREQRMTSTPRNWFSLIGLFCLTEGDNTFGAGVDNQIALSGLKQDKCGSFLLEGGKIRLVSPKCTELLVNGQPPEPRQLRADRDGDPDLIEIGSIGMRILRRGDRFMLRVWDYDSKSLKDFAGMKYFPVDPEYKVAADFVPFQPARVIKITDVIGTEYESRFLGEAQFTIKNKKYSLIAEEDDSELLFSFTDLTKTDSTYPGGRFFSADLPQDGKVTLDFNLAFNWPCAYTDFATCPIPPAENRLQVRIEAGEKRYKD